MIMQTFRVGLTVFVLAAMANTSSASFVSSFDAGTTLYNGLGEPVLTSYVISVMGASVFTDVNVVDFGSWLRGTPTPLEVHQVNHSFVSPPPQWIASIWMDEVPPASEVYDTHFMSSSDACDLLKLGHVALETNDSMSPTGVDKDFYGFDYGMGTFTSTPTDGFFLSSVSETLTPFMRVVVPCSYSDRWCVTGDTVVDGEVVPFAVYKVPEPGTVAMLIVGALCLTAVRLRKRILR